jgi:predicted aspartyl protease
MGAELSLANKNEQYQRAIVKAVGKAKAWWTRLDVVAIRHDQALSFANQNQIVSPLRKP